MRVADSPTLSDVERGLEMPLLEAMLTQRAIRRLRPDPIDDAIVLRCIEIGLKAPTSSNGQNWEWIVVKDPAVKQKLAAQYRQAWALYGGSIALMTPRRRYSQPWTGRWRTLPRCLSWWSRACVAVGCRYCPSHRWSN